MNIETGFSCCNHSPCLYWPLRDSYLMCLQFKWWRTKATVPTPYKNVFIFEANMKLQPSKLVKSNGYLLSYSLFSTKFPLFVAILSLQLTRETLSKETQSRNSILKTKCNCKCRRYPLYLINTIHMGTWLLF